MLCGGRLFECKLLLSAVSPSRDLRGRVSCVMVRGVGELGECKNVGVLQKWVRSMRTTQSPSIFSERGTEP